jgi:hypothetical protein
MRIRNVLQEFEARLEPQPGGRNPAGRGKAEWKVYGDGSRQCRVSISNLELPESALLGILVDGRQIAQAEVIGGKARFRRETERGELVPDVKADQVLQIVADGQVILEGFFYAE